MIILFHLLLLDWEMDAYIGRSTQLIAILLLCCMAGHIIASNPESSDLDCPYKPLPDSLDTLSGLGFDGEVHLHDQFYTEYVRGQSKSITFTISQPSAFRFYVEPHYVDIDVWLFNTTGQQAVVVVCSLLFLSLNYFSFSYFLSIIFLSFSIAFSISSSLLP